MNFLAITFFIELIFKAFLLEKQQTPESPTSSFIPILFLKIIIQ